MSEPKQPVGRDELEAALRAFLEKGSDAVKRAEGYWTDCAFCATRRRCIGNSLFLDRRGHYHEDDCVFAQALVLIERIDNDKREADWAAELAAEEEADRLEPTPS